MADTKTFDLSDKELNIGDVFTPLRWGEFAIQQFGIFQKWLDGATIFDPTMGEGNLLESLITYGISTGRSMDELPTQNLYGNELNTGHYHQALEKFQHLYGLNISSNFTNEDILRLGKNEYDIIFGNPPWQNFVDLPASYKQQIKRYFFQYDLVGNSQKLLLGGSRIDMAALIIQISIKDFLKKNGEAFFFMPLSLFLNDGAHRNFRTYSINEVKYSVESIYDFNDENVFGGVNTRYGLTHFVRDKKSCFPVPYYRMDSGTWSALVGRPMFHQTDPLSVWTQDESDNLVAMTPIMIKKESCPRQGINTCGANDIFFFDEWEEIDMELVQVSNRQKRDVILPKQFVFPLITTHDFKSENLSPYKWVLLPYNRNGKPLNGKQIQVFPSLERYFYENITPLKNRKGVMLNAMLKRGYWWALLGVGAYNFFPYKIVWEAYGKTTFNPKIFEGNWQANQSLQAFIPVKSLKEAESILHELSDKKIEDYLLSLKMEGTMNWAQPGKIKKLVRFEEESLTLF